jgi:hypothetical protein
MGVVLLPAAEAVLELEDVDRVVLYFVVVVVGGGHGGDEKVHQHEHHGDVEGEEVGPSHPAATPLSPKLQCLCICADIMAAVRIGGILQEG